MSRSVGALWKTQSASCPRCLSSPLFRRRCLARPNAPATACSSGSHKGARTFAQTAFYRVGAATTYQLDSLKNPEPSAPSSGLKALRNRNRALKQNAKTNGRTSSRTILGQSSELPIRARFAPSPTGYLHLGSLRTALFNRLAASASKGGAFVLRVEDTDQSRLVHDAEERLLQDLKWAGLSWDEGPDCGGPYGPYKQSERLPIYKSHVQTLLDRGHAYRCFCSSEHLESQKRQLHDAGKSTAYPGTCRSIDAAESEKRAANGDAHVVRLKGDAFGRPKFHDAIYMAFQKKDVEEDFVLLKTDGFPTYHLANVVDDHLMEITHVIRGEEWLISTPKHLALYEAFGWKPPTFAHLGLLVNSDGSKLSKRNDSVNLSSYQAKGVFPMSLLCWLANLGSSFDSKALAKIPRTVSDIADALTFKFTRGGIKLNFEKLDHFQSKYRDAILWDPIPELSQQEKELMNDYVTKQMLSKIDSITRGDDLSSELLPEGWHMPLTYVPAMLEDEANRVSYIYSLVSAKRGGFLTADSLIKQHPYLLWQVPDSLYRHSLASFTPDQRILQALYAAIDSQELWKSDGVEVMDAIWATLSSHQDISKLVVYETLRLVGAGGHNVPSQSSSRMFMLLGRDEWRIRLDSIMRLLQEPSHRGGPDA